jgi:hypothetical protein
MERGIFYTGVPVPQSDYIHLNCTEILAESDAAILVQFDEDNDNREEWIPKSQIADVSDYHKGMKGEITISIREWLVKVKELEGSE